MEKMNTKPSFFAHVKWENLFAGISGGVVATVILHPLDLVKTRFQVHEGVATITGSVGRPSYRGTFHAFQSIYNSQGIGGLYQGVQPNLLGSGSQWGLYFLFYNSIKTHLQERRGGTLGAGEHLVSATAAGMLTTTLANPISVVKTRLCLQYKHDRVVYSGILDCFCRTYKLEGLAGLYKGYLPALLGVSHGALQFMIYEELKKYYNSRLSRPADTKLTSTEYVTFAAASKMCAALSTYPCQVVRARLQDQHRQYTGCVDVLAQTLKYEGVRGFYKGFTPYLLHVTPSICIIFLLYEHVGNFFRAVRLKRESETQC